MKRAHVIFMTAAVVTLTAMPLGAAVRVDTAEAKERPVAFRVGGKNYITTNPGNSLDLTGIKIGSKQTFILIDLNGGELGNGDRVRIRYVPNSGGKPDPSKASFWVELKEGVKRARDGDVFTVKQVEAKYAFQTPSGKFVGAPVDGGLLGVTDKQEGALLVDLFDPATRTAIPPVSDQPASKEPAAPTSQKPAPEKPDTEKPATE
jgi:hypothetical protein